LKKSFRLKDNDFKKNLNKPFKLQAPLKQNLRYEYKNKKMRFDLSQTLFRLYLLKKIDLNRKIKLSKLKNKSFGHRLKANRKMLLKSLKEN